MDLYFKKTINYKYLNYSFSFDVANTIFSTFDIDIGTQLLIRNIKLNYKPSNLLDLGCGYGVLGIVFSKMFNIPKVTFVDKDMLSLRYSKINADNNEINNYELISSVGLEKVHKQKFDLIVSNIPAKIGDEAIEKDFILKPLEYLGENGEYWFVVVTALNRLIPSLKEKYSLNLVQITKRNRYSVYRILK